MKKVVTLLAALVLAATLSFAPAASAHEGDEANGARSANEARSEHLLGVNWDAPWTSRALVVGGLAVVGVGVYATQRRDRRLSGQ
jgi:hypothetical protein